MRKQIDAKTYIEDRVYMDPNSGCWLWTLGVERHGYGESRFNGRPIRGHRLAWEAFKGPIPEGQCVCHRCDTPACCNPNHLFLGTHVENGIDRVRKGRGAKGESINTAKLTEAQVADIRASGDSRKSLASRFGVCVNTITNIRMGITWKHSHG